MEQTETSQEKDYRLNIKQTAKGSFYAEWTIRGNSIEEIKSNNEALKTYVLEQLKTLNCVKITQNDDIIE